MLKLYNTLTKKKEEFVPLNDKKVNMYVCGITPYGPTHVGHARCYITFDIIRRYLEHQGYSVTYIQNFTDVDDKIIKKAKEDNISIYDLSNKYIDEYVDVMGKLNVKKPTISLKVTDNIEDIIKAVVKLIDKGYAYEVDGNVYFKLKSFKEYGKLSCKKIEDLEIGARVEVEIEKQDPLDFALWKKKKEDEPSWPSPWGEGRPGWHIECSVLSIKHIGDTLDIHGGGMDLIFPHHENEVAQSEALTDKEFSKYWIHNGFVTTNFEKMSKSLGNIFDLATLLEKFDPMVLRILLLSLHYKSPIDFTLDKLEESKKRLGKFLDLKKKLEDYKNESKNISIPEIQDIEKEFFDGMNDDFNTAIALSCLHKILDYANKRYTENENQLDDNIYFAWKKIEELGKILGLFENVEQDDDLDFYIKEKIEQRNRARKNKDFEMADKIREELKDQDIMLEDTPQGTIYKKL